METFPQTAIDTQLTTPVHTRTYRYPGGHTAHVKDVVEFMLRPSGDHRLKCADGSHHIVRSGWHHLEIIGLDHWTI